MDDHDVGAGRVEWLDVGPAPRSELGAQGAAHRPRRWWYLAVAVVVVAAALVVATRHGGRQGGRNAALASSHPTDAPLSTSVASLSPGRTAAGTPGPVTVTELGHPLLDVPPDWELFGLGSGVLVRIQLGLGRVTRTTVPPLNSSGPVSFVVGRDRALIRPLDLEPAYVVPDGRPPRPQPAALGMGGLALPGPDPDHVWVQPTNDRNATLRLFGFDGTPTGAVIPVPADAGDVEADGSGNALFYATGGVYDARPGAVRRITTGNLLAAGPTRWLAVECDDRDRCATTVVDRSSGARRGLETPVDLFATYGVISPDGATAAILGTAPSRTDTALYLLDLASGTDQATGASLDLAQSGGPQRPFVWSPDGRWLFASTAAGRLFAINGHSSHVQDLGLALPRLSQLVLRSAPR